MSEEHFKDRADAGRKLALKLLRFIGVDCIVYGVARGGVVVASEVAQHLDSPLEVIVVRKLGHPGSPEFALGAITAAGDIVLEESAGDRVSAEWLDDESEKEALEAVRRETIYLKDREPRNSEGKVAIVVDDGIATGISMSAALLAVRRLNPTRIVVATPVASPSAVSRLEALADEVVTLLTTFSLRAVGQAYLDFTQVSDDDVLKCLRANPAARKRKT